MPHHREECIMCDGTGVEYGTGKLCETCQGRGWEQVTRDDLWIRRRRFLGSAHPKANKQGYEKYVWLTIEVPPGIAEDLDVFVKQVQRTNPSIHKYSRSAAMRRALRELLDKYVPEDPEDVEGVAMPIIDVRELNPGETDA